MRLKNFNISYGSQIFKSFSEESRIRMLHLIYHKKEMCISDLELILEYTQTKTSRHLTYLKNAGIVGIRKVDQWVFYHIKDEVLDVITQIFTYLNKDSVLLNDLKTFDILDSNRELAITKLGANKWKN